MAAGARVKTGGAVNSPLDDALRAYLDHLTVERGAAANTLSSYRRDLDRYREYLAALGVDDLAAVTSGQVSGFLVAMREGSDGRPPLAASSAARSLIAVRGLHRFAAAEGLTPSDVAREVRPPAPAKRLPKALPVDTVIALLEAAGGDGESDTPSRLRDRALLELLYSCGARISEVTALDVDDIDAQSRSVVLLGKGGKQRVVPIGRPALAAIDAYLVRGRPSLVKRSGSRRGRCSRPPPSVPGSTPPPPTSHRTPCGTPSPRTCSTGEPTCGWCRSCWGTRR
ncbi:hypothetical protein GCM10009551_086620 [Nocardiopsis tropica]